MAKTSFIHYETETDVVGLSHLVTVVLAWHFTKQARRRVFLVVNIYIFPVDKYVPKGCPIFLTFRLGELSQIA